MPKDKKPLTSTVKIAKLIEVLKKNRDRHKELYEEATKNYRKTLVDTFQHGLNLAKRYAKDPENNKEPDQYLHVPRPENHLKEYDNLILMLEMTEEQTIVLDEREFAQYVRDEWHWKGKFLNSVNPHGVTLTDLETSYL